MPDPAGTLTLVIMGVSGVGKSTVMEALATRIDAATADGDAFHPAANVAKMSNGIPLTDDDRWPWLRAIARWIGQQERDRRDAIVTCSALKRSYRDQLRVSASDLRFIFLDLDQASARERVAARASHLFPPALVASQYATLESPLGEPGVLRLDATLPPPELLSQSLRWLALPSTRTPTP